MPTETNGTPWNLNALVEEARAVGWYVERLLKRLGLAVTDRRGKKKLSATTTYVLGDVMVAVTVMWLGPDSGFAVLEVNPKEQEER